jgi:thiol-disulfide isomerase/thioredoxin
MFSLFYCQAIAPKFSEFASHFPQAIFVKVGCFQSFAQNHSFIMACLLKVDVDECPDVTNEVGKVRGMPTFKVLSVGGGKELESLTGADEGKLQAMLNRHCNY